MSVNIVNNNDSDSDPDKPGPKTLTTEETEDKYEENNKI